MTVKELMLELIKLPQDAPVKVRIFNQDIADTECDHRPDLFLYLEIDAIIKEDKVIIMTMNKVFNYESCF